LDGIPLVDKGGTKFLFAFWLIQYMLTGIKIRASGRPVQTSNKLSFQELLDDIGRYHPSK
jgi:hypothetical protein